MNRFYHVSSEKTTLFNKKLPRREKRRGAHPLGGEAVMNKLLERAKELQPELVENRRWLHSHAEVGFELTETCAFVEEKLRELGYEPRRMSKAGVVATLGKPGGKTILLRADMDALPMKEESGLAFAAKGDAAHTCGHDLHTAMLLGAAKLLKEHESELNGCVKLMFQPDEEGTNPLGFSGSQAMLEDGLKRELERLVGEDGEVLSVTYAARAADGLLRVTAQAECREEIGQEVPAPESDRPAETGGPPE